MRKDDHGLYLKVISRHNRGNFSGYDFSDYLPRRGKAGPWLPATDKVVLCCIGYHVTSREYLYNWWNWSGANLWIVQVRGNHTLNYRYADKIAFTEMRFICKAKTSKYSDADTVEMNGAIAKARKKAFRILRKERNAEMQQNGPE